MTARGSAASATSARHRHAVDDDDARARCGVSSLAARSASGHRQRADRPLGVRPPLLTTATRASSTWRSPASPRSWVTASWIRPMPWVRPCESWPPWVFSGITPSRAMFLPPSRKSLASPMPQKPSASSHDRQLKVNPSYSSATSTSLGPQRRSRPQVRGLAQHLWFVGQRGLVPVDPFDDLGADGLEQHGRLGHVRAASTAETMTAMAPSHGTSQS